jgi:hypothetical protein
VRANVFEGARRILVVIQVLWVVFVFAMAFVIANDARVEIYSDRIPHQKVPVMRLDGAPECDSNNGDVSEMAFRTTRRGTGVNLILCYRTLRTVVAAMPERASESPRSNEEASDNYARQYAEKEQLTPEMESRADSLRLRQRFATAGYAVLAAAGGWFVLWLLGTVIGWVARGFIAPPAAAKR